MNASLYHLQNTLTCFEIFCKYVDVVYYLGVAFVCLIYGLCRIIWQLNKCVIIVSFVVNAEAGVVNWRAK